MFYVVIVNKGEVRLISVACKRRRLISNKTDYAEATHICTELKTKVLENNCNPDNHVRPFDCVICFVETKLP